ncbi:MAG: YfhO family protein [Bryobacterales bacterium]|nr:YfhO family protein [Bryobacterales bacterium]
MRSAILRNRTLGWVLDSLLVFALAAALIWPLFQTNYSDRWSSIESTFISDARFLRDHWPHPRWQPLWYTGTRFDYIYPPALRYGTAVQTVLFPSRTPAQSYHFYVALLYAIGIAGVYVLSRTGGKSRMFAIVAALAVATISPTFLLISEIRADARASWSEPQRLGALVRYGEGPHMSAVAILGFVLAFSILAFRSGKAGWIAAASIAAALAVSHNFYGATALAMLFPLLVWSWWITHLDNRIFLRALAIAAIGYGLCAFWLVPSYVLVTLNNMRFVSERGNRWSLWAALVLAVVYMKLTGRWARGRPERAYAVFLWGAFVFFFLNVIGNYYLKFRVIGEPTRMIPELDLIIILAGAEILRRLWAGECGAIYQKMARWPVMRYALVAALVFLLFHSVRKYITGAWNIYLPDANYQARVEYRITSWIAKNMPAARAYTTGSVRFWYDAWHDLAELGGGSEQGLLNPMVQPATWQLGGGDDAELGILWMLCTGVDLAIVHDQRSQEPYKDVVHPKKFQGLLKTVYDNGEGDFIYKVPRRYPSLARVVETARLDALPLFPEEPNKEQLKTLANLLENGPDSPTQTRWEGTDKLRLHAAPRQGQTLFVQVAYDSPWRAWANGRELPVRRTQLGFLRIDAPPGEHDIELVFQLPPENVFGRIVTLFTAAALVWLLRRPRRAW